MTRRRKWLLVLLGAPALVAAGSALWLLRDPVPRFEARRGTLRSANERPATIHGSSTAQDVTLVGSSGLRVEIAVHRPTTNETLTAPVRRRLFLVLGGHERGKAAGALIPDTHGNVFAFLEYPFYGDHRASGLAVLAQVPAIRRAFFDTPPSVQLALDYLLQRADVDPSRVELVGASFGVPFATIAAARDPRVTRLWLAHGGGDPYLLINHGLRRDVRFAPARAALAGLGTLLVSGPRFAPEHWIDAVSPRPVVMLNAEADEKIPRRSVEVLWNSAREPKELVWLPGQHVQGNRPDVLARLVDEVLIRAERSESATAPTPR